MKSLVPSLILPAFVIGFSLHEYLPVPSFLTYFVILVYIYFMFKLYQEKQQRKVKWFSEIEKFSFPTTNETKIRVVSYNIFLRPPLVNNNGDDYKNERFQEFIKLIDKYDVIALQEIFPLGNMRPSYLIKYSKKLGFHWHIRSVQPNSIQKNFLDAGLLILSKYPIVAKDYRIYKHAHQVDSWVAKQVIYAKVHFPHHFPHKKKKIQVSKNQYFHIFTTHMQASYNDTTEYHNKHNDKCRIKQVEEMADFIHEKTHNDPHPALITGDFNVNAKGEDEDKESIEYKYLINKLNRDSESCSKDHLPVRNLLKEHNKDYHPNTYADIHPENPTKPRETILTHTADHCTALCIDYMMLLDTKVNNACKGIVVQENSTKVEEFFVEGVPKITQLSDHYAVETTLVVNPENVPNKSKL